MFVCPGAVALGDVGAGEVSVDAVSGTVVVAVWLPAFAALLWLGWAL